MLRTLSVIAAAIAMSPVQAAAAAPSGGVTITLRCEIGSVGTGTFKLTANASSSLVTVPCGGSATATNAAWMPGAEATIDQTAGPAGTVRATNQRVYLATYAVSFSTMAHACSPAFTAAECPPGTSGRRATTVPWGRIARLIGVLVLGTAAALLLPGPVGGQR